MAASARCYAILSTVAPTADGARTYTTAGVITHSSDKTFRWLETCAMYVYNATYLDICACMCVIVLRWPEICTVPVCCFVFVFVCFLFVFCCVVCMFIRISIPLVETSAMYMFLLHVCYMSLCTIIVLCFECVLR